MSDERWVVEVASSYLWDVWHPCSAVNGTVKYVSAEVADLALRYHWQPTHPRFTFRVRRVA